MFLASDSSQTVEVIIFKLGTVTASDMGMHRVIFILTVSVTFIQYHVNLNHENNKGLIISETIQEMPINFAVKIVYMTIASPMTLTIQGHKCVSNGTTF